MSDASTASKMSSSSDWSVGVEESLSASKTSLADCEAAFKSPVAYQKQQNKNMPVTLDEERQRAKKKNQTPPTPKTHKLNANQHSRDFHKLRLGSKRHAME